MNSSCDNGITNKHERTTKQTMTCKELMDKLATMNPEADVTILAWNESNDAIEGVLFDIRQSPEGDEIVVSTHEITAEASWWS